MKYLINEEYSERSKGIGTFIFQLKSFVGEPKKRTLQTRERLKKSNKTAYGQAKATKVMGPPLHLALTYTYMSIGWLHR